MIQRAPRFKKKNGGRDDSMFDQGFTVFYIREYELYYNSVGWSTTSFTHF